MKLTELFDRTYVLNLPDRADRRREMDAVFRKAGIDWEPGKVELFPAVRPDSPGGFESVGARGCFLGHLGMLQKAREAGARRVLIMEDDLDLIDDYPAIEARVADRLARDDWGFAYLGHSLGLLDPPVPPGTMVPLQGRWATTHFLAVHGRVLDSMVRFFEQMRDRPPGHPDGGPMHMDGAFFVYREKHPDLVTLVPYPSLGHQRSSRSDINGRKVDRIPVVRDLLQIARRVRRRLNPGKIRPSGMPGA